MSYLYHRVPNKMEGTVLYPLNILKQKTPELYQKEFVKYAGREHVMQQFIPTLKCMWNDVLHLSPIYPSDLKAALNEAGTQTPEMKFYQIDPFSLDPTNTTVYLYKHTSKEGNTKPENFTSYDPNTIEQYSVLSEETKIYYKEMHDKGEHPLLFVRVPHILYKGSIDVSKCKIITA